MPGHHNVDAPPLLTVQDLRIQIDGRLLLTVPSLTILRGEVLAVLGPNGAGKSTLLQALACLRESTTGTLTFEEQRVDLRAPTLEFRRRLAVVFQEPLLFDTTVAENIASGLQLRGLAKALITEKVALWLDQLGINHLAHRQARTLSGGEAQRTSLARAFVLSPDLLLLDEPFSALDTPTREALLEIVHRVQQHTRVTTLFVTHDRLEALRLGNRVAVMDKGEIVQIGTAEEIFSQPVSETVANFVGIETILRGTVACQSDGFAEIGVAPEKRIAAASPLPLGTEVTLCLRPEEVTLLAPPAEGVLEQPSSARNQFLAGVTRIIPWGLAYKIHLDCGFPLVAFVTRPSLEVLNLRAGGTVLATFKATAVHVLPR
ncbi:MAG: ABC transporter ATP-binding protein [Deltaproteobacteria bacterium]|nr:ABC transporter ATP-binding protein [Deltaproteobacteria bacterium]